MVNDQDTTQIVSGLSPGEIVVVNGVDKLQDGTKVEPTRRAGGRPTSRSATSQPGGHHRRSLTGDSDASRNGG
jgi:multidrug efflux system membrane fusion protein